MPQYLPRSIRLWGMGCHLSGVVCAFCNCVMIPFISLVVPYLVWLGGRDKDSFVDQQGRESLNFQISMAIYAISGGILFIFLFLLTCGVALSSSNPSDAITPQGEQIIGNIFEWLVIVLLSLIALFAFFQIAVIILAAAKAYNGQSYRYPFTLRFLR